MPGGVPGARNGPQQAVPEGGSDEGGSVTPAAPSPHRLILLDGSMTHELKSRGVRSLAEYLPSDSGAAAAALANHFSSTSVLQVHHEYLDAGCQAVTANSFACTRHALRHLDWQDARKRPSASHSENDTLDAASAPTLLAASACALARRAVQEAQRAKQGRRPALVAASLPCLGESYDASSSPGDAEMREEYAELAAAMAPDADVFLCETLGSAREAICALDAAARVGTAPVWLSWTISDVDGKLLRCGEPLERAVAHVLQACRDVPPRAWGGDRGSGGSADAGISAAGAHLCPVRSPAALLVNCASPRAALQGLAALRRALERARREGWEEAAQVRMGAYPNGFRQTTTEWRKDVEAGELGGGSMHDTAPAPAGNPSLDTEMPNVAEEYDERGILTPDAFVRWGRASAALGATIIGGCCGIGPKHLAALSRALTSSTANATAAANT